MKYYLEKIETNAKLPAKIYMGTEQEGDGDYPLHWHQHLEFDLVLEGAIIGRVNGRPVEIGAGDFLFVNSGELHETKRKCRDRMRTITILLSSALLKEYCPDVEGSSFDFSGNQEASEQAKELILLCAKLQEEQGPFYELELSIALRKLCLILLRDCRVLCEPLPYRRYEQESRRNVKRAIAFLEEHYEQDLSLARTASEIGMAPTYFSRFFKKTTGETYHSYLTSIRLFHAHKDLLNRDASITDIALANGFANVKAFIEAFKKGYHATPAQYRKDHHGGRR